MSRRIKEGVSNCEKNRICFFVRIVIIYVITIGGYVLLYHRFDIRFDQYAITICTCIAGIVATMFGLTAASYAFIWGDLRTEALENRHLQKILQQYKDDLWKKFFCSLVLTVVTIVISLMLLMFAQNITDPSLYVIQKTKQGEPYAEYFNDHHFWISLGTVIDCVCAMGSVFVMAMMNYAIFQRKRTYEKIAEGYIQEIREKYCLDDLEVPERLKKKNSYPQEEFEKIHSLEQIIDRIVENHASIGEAFEPERRREKLLSFLLAQTLDRAYGFKDKDIDGKRNEEKNDGWEYLTEKKRTSLQQKYSEHAEREYHNFVNPNDIYEVALADGELKEAPRNRRFISVYEDMLAYRDNALVYSGEDESIRKCSLGKSMKK